MTFGKSGHDRTLNHESVAYIRRALRCSIWSIPGFTSFINDTQMSGNIAIFLRRSIASTFNIYILSTIANNR
jgi:hypothetical protein